MAPIADTVQQVEAKLLQKKIELRQFESEYRQVSQLGMQLSDNFVLDMSCCSETGLAKWTDWNIVCLGLFAYFDAYVVVNQNSTGVPQVY